MQYGGYNLPPVVSSLIPFVGSGLSFAGGPLQYTTDAYKKVQPPLYSIHLHLGLFLYFICIIFVFRRFCILFVFLYVRN